MRLEEIENTKIKDEEHIAHSFGRVWREFVSRSHYYASGNAKAAAFWHSPKKVQVKFVVGLVLDNWNEATDSGKWLADITKAEMFDIKWEKDFGLKAKHNDWVALINKAEQEIIQKANDLDSSPVEGIDDLLNFLLN